MHRKYYLIILTCLLPFLSNSQSELGKVYDAVVKSGLIDYQELKLNQAELTNSREGLIASINAELSEKNNVAALINLYNVLVLQEIMEHYPINSVEQIKGFFTKKLNIGTDQMSLNEIEELIFKISEDPRIHLALNCGAKSCPPFANIVFSEDQLGKELDEVCKIAFEKEHIIDIDEKAKTIYLNQIFRWYHKDFDEKGLFNFINTYVSNSVDDSYSIKYLPYDWSVNSFAPLRYFASRLYEKGEFEIQLFNNYYTQKETGLMEEDNFGRYNFFSNFLNTTIGISNRLNIGLGIKIRSVYQSQVSTGGVFKALNYHNKGFVTDPNNNTTGYTRAGVTAFYPSVKYAPFSSHENVSLYHSIVFPLGNELEGNDVHGFIDWSGVSLQNSIYIDKEIGTSRSVFYEGTLLLENIGKLISSPDDAYSQLGISATTIYNYFPTDKFTYYGLINLVPRISISKGSGTEVRFIPYAQIGGGIKYFLTERLETEILYTFFYDGNPNRVAHTFNLGFRYYGI